MSFDFETVEALTANTDTLDSQLSRPAPPPLRIHHFFLCGIVTAIYLSWWRQVVPPSAVEQLPVWAIGFTAILNALQAIAFTLAALSLYWRFKGYAGLEQPGVWLLLSWLVVIIPTVINMLVMRFSWFDWWGGRSGIYGRVYWVLAYAPSLVLFTFIPLAFYAYSAWAIADTRAWRWVFVVIAIISVLPIVAWGSQILYSNFNVPTQTAVAVPSFVSAVAILATEIWALVTDIKQQRKRQRYWPHWVGLGLVITQQSLLTFGALIALLGG